MKKLLVNLKPFGQRPALIQGDLLRSYDWLTARIETLGRLFDNAGLPDGAVVALETSFSPEGVALFFALAARKCVLMPLANNRGGERERLLDIAGVQYRIVPDGGGVTPTCGDVRAPTVIARDKAADTTPHPLYKTLRQRKHAGLVLFSSGSTGDPKGIVHDLDLLAERFAEPRKAYRAIAFLLFDHIGGINTMLYMLSSGGCLVIVRDRKPDIVLEAVEKHRVELLPASPTFLNLILASEAYKTYDLSSLKVISYGAEPMPEGTLHRIHELLPGVRLQQTYGLSEVGILATKSRSSDSLWLKAGGDGFETRIVDGVLHIRARTAMLGYLNAPSPFTEDGWLNTGDAVEVDGEYIRFLGREDDRINVGGEKVNPTEVENIIEALDEVQQAVVYGEKNPLLGAVVSARIVPSPAAGAADPAELRKLIRTHCQVKLPRYKVPVRIEIQDKIQHTTRFKKKR